MTRHHIRSLSPLLALLALLTVSVPCPAGALEFEVGLSGGWLAVDHDTDSEKYEPDDAFTGGPVGGLELRVRWPVGNPPLHLGLRLDIPTATVPYGNCDGEIIFAQRCFWDREGWGSKYEEHQTFFPGLLFELSWRWGGYALDTSLGARHLVGASGRMAIVPMPSAGIGLARRLWGDEHLGVWLRAKYDYLYLLQENKDGAHFAQLMLATSFD